MVVRVSSGRRPGIVAGATTVAAFGQNFERVHPLKRFATRARASRDSSQFATARAGRPDSNPPTRPRRGPPLYVSEEWKRRAVAGCSKGCVGYRLPVRSAFIDTDFLSASAVLRMVSFRQAISVGSSSLSTFSRS